MIDRDQFNFKGQLKRCLDQPATGPSCAAEKVYAINFQEKPPGPRVNAFIAIGNKLSCELVVRLKGLDRGLIGRCNTGSLGAVICILRTLENT
jgi:hypothetical protein